MAEIQTTARADEPVIICYDGSEPATYALSTVAGLLPGPRALVVTVWKPFAGTMLAVEIIGLGSVSSPLVHHASRTVLVVPSPRDGTERQPQSSERRGHSETSGA